MWDQSIGCAHWSTSKKSEDEQNIYVNPLTLCYRCNGQFGTLLHPMRANAIECIREGNVQERLAYIAYFVFTVLIIVSRAHFVVRFFWRVNKRSKHSRLDLVIFFISCRFWTSTSTVLALARTICFQPFWLWSWDWVGELDRFRDVISSANSTLLRWFACMLLSTDN